MVAGRLGKMRIWSNIDRDKSTISPTLLSYSLNSAHWKLAFRECQKPSRSVPRSRKGNSNIQRECRNPFVSFSFSVFYIPPSKQSSGSDTVDYYWQWESTRANCETKDPFFSRVMFPRVRSQSPLFFLSVLHPCGLKCKHSGKNTQPQSSCQRTNKRNQKELGKLQRGRNSATETWFH